MEYEINNDTQTILPLSEKTSKVIEKENQYVIQKSTFEVIEHSCEYFGSTYEGRKIGTKKLTGVTHKAPIIVEESRKIIFFPTKSHDRVDCIWVNLNQIDTYHKKGNHESAIKFKSGDILELDISYGSLANQILRASRLKCLLEERIAKKENN